MLGQEIVLLSRDVIDLRPLQVVAEFSQVEYRVEADGLDALAQEVTLDELEPAIQDILRGPLMAKQLGLLDSPSLLET